MLHEFVDKTKQQMSSLSTRVDSPETRKINVINNQSVLIIDHIIESINLIDYNSFQDKDGSV